MTNRRGDAETRRRGDQDPRDDTASSSSVAPSAFSSSIPSQNVPASNSVLSTQYSVLPVLPGATLGVLGSGQLGRMFALAARRMGYRVHTFSPEHDTPTGQVADREVSAAYEDLDAVREFARGVSAVTFEFENVHSATAEAVAEIVPV